MLALKDKALTTAKALPVNTIESGHWHCFQCNRVIQS